MLPAVTKVHNIMCKCSMVLQRPCVCTVCACCLLAAVQRETGTCNCVCTVPIFSELACRMLQECQRHCEETCLLPVQAHAVYSV